jgi:bacterioferritin-associated ferredoxin
MYVCVCHAVPETVVAEWARAGLSAEEVAERTRAGTSCGLCAPDLAAVVSRHRRCERTGGACTGCGHDGAPAPAARPDRDAA